MKVALLHNPGAGKAMLKGRKLVRQLEYAGHQVLYVSIKGKDWQRVFGESIERAIIAGGDGTVSRLAPWLAGRNIPFCILPLGTANNCARSLDQMHPVEKMLSRLHSAPVKKLDLGMVTSSEGHRIFVESTGLGLLAMFMDEMRLLEKKKNSRMRLSPQKRLAQALKYLGRLTKEFSGSRCELLLDDEIVVGNFLMMEISNMRFVGPKLDLVPNADPGDGHFDVIWLDTDRRQAWRDYLKACRRGEEADAPVHTRRCRRAVLRCADVPMHVDGKVFSTMATPISVRIQPEVLEVLDFSSRD
jgi:diacylglycerol kinase (ATP)